MAEWTDWAALTYKKQQPPMFMGELVLPWFPMEVRGG